MSELITLAECPVGLFRSSLGNLCVKTEYSNNEGRIDAFIVETGEFFWGSSPQTVASQRMELVTPISMKMVTENAILAEKNTSLARYVETLANWMEHNGDDGNEPLLFAKVIAEARNEIKRLRRDLEIAETPPCFSCGAKITETCPRPPSTPCGREFHGGSRYGDKV